MAAVPGRAQVRVQEEASVRVQAPVPAREGARVQGGAAWATAWDSAARAVLAVVPVRGRAWVRVTAPATALAPAWGMAPGPAWARGSGRGPVRVPGRVLVLVLVQG
ncbi:MAG: hypothetical protein Q4E06_09670 [Lautropia sp.]|nr:hypothetical protein [Lautropia sp.]